MAMFKGVARLALLVWVAGCGTSDLHELVDCGDDGPLTMCERACLNAPTPHEGPACEAEGGRTCGATFEADGTQGCCFVDDDEPFIRFAECD